MTDQPLALAKKLARRYVHGVEDLTDDAAWTVASPLLRENLLEISRIAEGHFAERDNEYVRLANRDLGRVYDHNQRLTLAMTELLNACHADFGVPDEGDGDNEPVGASIESPMALQFGMLRRAAAAVAAATFDPEAYKGPWHIVHHVAAGTRATVEVSRDKSCVMLGGIQLRCWGEDKTADEIWCHAYNRALDHAAAVRRLDATGGVQ